MSDDERRGTKILGCSCENRWQDSRYGKGKRVHNRMARAQSGPQRWRCTSCEATHEG